MDDLATSSLLLSRAMLALLSVCILVRCLRSMLSERYEPEQWASLQLGKESFPITHWENLLGRSRSADVRVDRERVSRVHAVLKRGARGVWTVYDVFSRGGVWVNDEKVGPEGAELCSGDVINLGGTALRFQELSPDKRRRLEAKRTSAGNRVSPCVSLIELTLFQGFLLLQLFLSLPGHIVPVALSFAALAALEWFCYFAMRLIDRSGFEIETLAFYLTSIGLAVAASSVPDKLLRQILLMVAAVALFLLLGWWLRSLRRVTAVRALVAAAALALLALNLALGEEIGGARNWVTVGSYSFQPSEFVKLAYLYVGASTLDRLYRSRNLFVFLVFSAVCVGAMALLGDFGTALVFFVCFLVIAFMRSGSIATLLLALTGAGMAGMLAASVKPHIAQRFAAWGHVWDDVYGAGYQQARALSAAASGGLFGKGAGGGWLKNVTAANTDMVFAMVCEEEGLIVAFCMVLAVLAMAFFAVRATRYGRSAWFAIAACGAVTILLTQTALNVFGSLDLLPFTGVTFPFVSRGNSSLLCCWMLMAFLKGADTRRGASFVVDPLRDDEAEERSAR
ncbi:MAG: FtsW/RodA/SpoVE family cell cycle protein [Oscillospiraceae bacterium]|nr:FtsW/RodA/SpoVE family cell cycle protein [Oscillospiraceae bacterium]